MRRRPYTRAEAAARTAEVLAGCPRLLRPKCSYCGDLVTWSEKNFAVYCSSECRRNAEGKRRAERAKAARGRAKCKHCRRRFDAPRRDTRYCSPACRQAAYRARTRAVKR